MDSEVIDAVPEKGATSSGIVHVKAIVGDNWIEDRLKMKVKWNTEQFS